MLSMETFVLKGLDCWVRSFCGLLEFWSPDAREPFQGKIGEIM